MRWQDQAIVLGLYPLGETKKVATLLTHDHGRHKGLWRPTKSLQIQPAALVTANWSARLPEQLGTWSLEMGLQTVAYFMQEPELLMAAHGAVSLCDILLPEREPVPLIYAAFYQFLMQRTLKAYCFFELTLLNQTSFPLDLKTCALRGVLTHPAYVSPKTGRAVSGAYAAEYIPRLLPLPFFMYDAQNDPTLPDIIAGLHLTGYFLERYSLDHQGKALPLVRQRLVNYLVKKVEGNRLND